MLLIRPIDLPLTFSFSLFLPDLLGGSTATPPIGFCANEIKKQKWKKKNWIQSQQNQIQFNVIRKFYNECHSLSVKQFILKFFKSWSKALFQLRFWRREKQIAELLQSSGIVIGFIEDRQAKNTVMIYREFSCGSNKAMTLIIYINIEKERAREYSHDSE